MGKDSLTKSTTKKKASTKKKKTAVAKTTAKKAKAAAPTLRDLLHKKFDRVVPGSLYQPPAAAARPDVASPPFFEADDPEDVKRVRALLFKKYNLAELAAAAKAEEEARKKAEAEAKAKAEEEARKKAEAEAKAKAEEEARIKAEAEKLAAERAAARKAAAASEPQVSVTYEGAKDTPPSAPSAPVDNTGRWVMMGLAGGIALLFVLIIGASLANSSKYYLKSTSQGLEIHQGKFAPLGSRQILFLPGVTGPETPAPVYRRAEVMPLAVQYFLAQADARLAGATVPDFQQAKAPLEKALEYATTSDEKQLIQARLDAIDRAMLIYKAQISAARQTLDGYDEALAAYRDALRLADDDADIQVIETRITAVEKARADLKARLAEEAAAKEMAAEENKTAAD